MNQAAAFNDMQALVRFGHGKLSDSRFLLLNIADKRAAGRWLSNTTFNSAETVSPLPETALHIAFTATGLSAIGLPEKTLAQFSEEYLVGMSADESRSRRLGDVGNNDPRHWQWGHHDRNEIHILLMLYTRSGGVDAAYKELNNADFQAGFSVLHHLPTSAISRHEPFGFVDGISQPDIDWEQKQRTDIHAREAYSNLLAPGEIVLGYPNEYGQIAQRPFVENTDADAASTLPQASHQSNTFDFGMNGSYLVLRQLQQDVPGFWKFMHEQRNDQTDQAVALASQMVGRHMDGTSLVEPAQRTIPGISVAKKKNHFDFEHDDKGLQCPISSHVRRSNPRTGDFPPGTQNALTRLFRMLGFKRSTEYEDLIASSRFHRLLRRGRVYGGDILDPRSAAQANKHTQSEQGLQFICLASNILRQFEFVQAAWSVSSGFAGLNAQRDPLTSHRHPRIDGRDTSSFTTATESGPQERTENLPVFVNVRGGAYFFMPGLRAIQFLGEISSTAEQTA